VKKTLFLSLSVLTISVLTISLISINSEIPQAFAKAPEKCTPWPECKQGSEDDDPPPPPPPTSNSATIELIDCDGDGADQWLPGSVTYRVVNKSGEKQATIDAVTDGILEWNIAGSPYSLEQAEDNDQAQITVNVYKKITPGYILGFAEVCSNTGSNIGGSVSISLGIKGLSTDGVKNLAAHEVGHGLGLGHTINFNGDLMAPSLDAKERKNLICPSNLNVGGLSVITPDVDPDTGALTFSVDPWVQLVC